MTFKTSKAIDAFVMFKNFKLRTDSDRFEMFQILSLNIQTNNRFFLRIKQVTRYLIFSVMMQIHQRNLFEKLQLFFKVKFLFFISNDSKM